MKLTIYSYVLTERYGTDIFSFISEEARDDALDAHLKEIASDHDIDLDPDDGPEQWAELLGVTLTYDSCVVEIPILDEASGLLASLVTMCPSSEGLGGHAPINAFLQLGEKARLILDRMKALK